jgi:GDPmannose 4,6-dehydratase
LLGDPTKAHQKLGWRHKTTFKELVAEMVASDRNAIRQESQRNDRSAG